MTTAKVVKPDNIQCTIQVTMSIEEWKSVKKTLNTNPNYAQLKVIREITGLVNQLEQTFYCHVDETE
jgi:hypothetical protein